MDPPSLTCPPSEVQNLPMFFNPVFMVTSETAHLSDKVVSWRCHLSHAYQTYHHQVQGRLQRYLLCEPFSVVTTALHSDVPGIQAALSLQATITLLEGP